MKLSRKNPRPRAFAFVVSEVENAFIFRDGRGRAYQVRWENGQSWLSAWRQGRWCTLRPVPNEDELEAFMDHEIPAGDYHAFDLSVRPMGRLFFLVSSHSRPDVVHVVDMEENIYGTRPACSCEHNTFRKARCSHLTAVEGYLASVADPYCRA